MSGPPHSESLEKSVLAGILVKPALLPAVQDILAPEDFYLERHQILYEAILNISRDQLDIDVVSLESELINIGKLAEAGGKAYIWTLDVELPSLGAVVGYAEQVKGHALRRDALKASKIASAGLSSGDMSLDELSGVLAGAARALEDATLRKGAAIDAASILDTLEPPEKYNPVPGLRTGFGRLDMALGGLGPGCLYVIGGRPANCKSALAGVIALNVALAGARTMFCTLEMSEQDVMRRMLAHHSRVPYESLETGKQMTPGLWESFHASRNALRRIPLLIDPVSRTLGAICAAARREQARSGLDLLVVDYLQLMQVPASGQSSREQQVSEMSRRLQALSMDLDIPVLLLAQLNRDVAKTGNWRPQLHHFRESGSVEQDAFAVVFSCLPETSYTLDAPERDEWQGKFVMCLAKNRNGEAGLEIHCHWEPRTFSITEIDYTTGAR